MRADRAAAPSARRRVGNPLQASPPLLLFAGFALVLVALLPPANYSSDGANMLAVSDSLVTNGDLDVPCGDQAILGRGGECYSTFYPLISFLAVPFVAIGRQAGALAGLSPEYVGHLVALLVPALAAAGAATMTVAIAWQLGATRRAGVLAGCAFAFATEALTYARTFYAETLAAFFVAASVWALAQDARRRWWAAPALALAILAKPQMVLVGPAIGFALALRTRDAVPVLIASAGTAVGAAVYGAYNWLRFESVTNFGGESRELGTDNYSPGALLDSLGLLLVSPGRGVIWFSPIVLVGAYLLIRRWREPLALACLAASGAILAIALGNPGEGYIWASRYLVPALPLLCAAVGLASGRLRHAAVAAAVIGVVVALPTTVAYFERYYAENRDAGRVASQRYWTFPEGPLLGVWGSAARQLEAAGRTDVAELVKRNETEAPGGFTHESVRSQERLRVVALWWWVLPAGGVPWPIGALVMVAAVTLGAYLLLRVSRIRVPP